MTVIPLADSLMLDECPEQPQRGLRRNGTPDSGTLALGLSYVVVVWWGCLGSRPSCTL